MKISSKKTNTGILLTFEGEMTIYHALEIKSQLCGYMKEYSEIELDLAQVTEMDSAGTQLLMLMKCELTKNGKILQVTSHSRAVMTVFELYNLAAYFGDPLLMSSATATVTNASQGAV